MKKILITGGAGFIGSNFIHYFLAKHPDVHIVNLDKLTYCGNLENLAGLEKEPRYEFVKGDICDPEAVSRAIEGADAVIHFAAESHVDNSIQDPLVFTKTNVLGTHVFLEEARKRKIARFVHISTDEVYGSVREGSSKETDPLIPSSPYSASKAAAELIVQGFFRTFGFPAVIVRGSNTFGPHQYPEKLIPLFATNLLEAKKVPLMGDGMHRRSWVYVRDFCRAVERVLIHGELGEIYNIPGTVELPNIEVTKRILPLLGKDESCIERVPDRLAHDRRYSVDGAKLMALGWKPEHDFDSALKETVAWYAEHEAWWKKLKK
ncbi:MAG: dTDP-glucose 4,6-dehydratase [Elusimicrobia bacterium RIFCSPLOWO2_01_FULL_54_10]|nr:MAG: dTDP-glucose 4,6-dehydratase [Elusimicrobia bacterium RIFCSPLOWO2_01_FULL_54_10]